MTATTLTLDSQAAGDNWTGLLQAMAAGVTSLSQALEQRSQLYPLTLYDLGSPEYELVQPLSIVVEEYGRGEEVIARCPELEAFGEGGTPAAAIHELKNALLDLYDELVATDPATLGELPLAWLRILNKVVVKVAA